MLLSTGEDRRKIHLRVDGLYTENSIRLIGCSLQALPGVQDLNFDPELKQLSLSYEPDLTGPRNFIEIIGLIGSGYVTRQRYFLKEAEENLIETRKSNDTASLFFGVWFSRFLFF